MAKVVIYTPSDFACPFCMRAKDLFKRRGIAFKEIQISSDDDAAWNVLIKKSGMKTVPQVFVDDRLIGGYTELAEQDGKDLLASFK